jgi:hypothetical protein
MAATPQDQPSSFVENPLVQELHNPMSTLNDSIQRDEDAPAQANREEAQLRQQHQHCQPSMARPIILDTQLTERSQDCGSVLVSYRSETEMDQLARESRALAPTRQ